MEKILVDNEVHLQVLTWLLGADVVPSENYTVMVICVQTVDEECRTKPK